jgi:hypothetical protein
MGWVRRDGDGMDRIVQRAHRIRQTANAKRNVIVRVHNIIRKVVTVMGWQLGRLQNGGEF